MVKYTVKTTFIYYFKHWLASLELMTVEKRIPNLSKNCFYFLHNYLVLHVYQILEKYLPTKLIGPTRLLISEKTFTYTIIRSYTIIWQVRVLSTHFVIVIPLFVDGTIVKQPSWGKMLDLNILPETEAKLTSQQALHE